MAEKSSAGPSGAQAMFERDRASRALGIQVLELGAGTALVSMAVREEMLNGFLVAHGAFIFAIADTAFALACNESAHVTLAAGAEITFLRPVSKGQKLLARAERRALSGRSGIYDVQVTDEAGLVVAEFRGRSRTTDRLVPSSLS